MNFYVYSFKDGRYCYERTCGTERAAQEWVGRLGHRATYLVDAIIHGAFY